MIIHFSDLDEFIEELRKDRSVLVRSIVRVTTVQKPSGVGLPTWELYLLSTALVKYLDGTDTDRGDVHVLRLRIHFGDIWPGHSQEGRNEERLKACHDARDRLIGWAEGNGCQARTGLYLEPSQTTIV